MNRILIWKKTALGCEYDIFTHTDYSGLYQHVKDSWGEFVKIGATKLISEGKIIVAYDMNDWSNYIKKNSFNYAFGSRIHGTIIAL